MMNYELMVMGYTFILVGLGSMALKIAWEAFTDEGDDHLTQDQFIRRDWSGRFTKRIYLFQDIFGKLKILKLRIIVRKIK